MTDAAEQTVEDECLEGYRDGLDPDTPKPGPNRSDAYTIGWLNGRDDWQRDPRAPAPLIREEYDRLVAEERRRIEIAFPT